MATSFSHIFRAKSHRDAVSLEHDGQRIVSFECLDKYTVEVWFEDGECILVDFDEIETAIIVTANRLPEVDEFGDFAD